MQAFDAPPGEIGASEDNGDENANCTKLLLTQMCALRLPKWRREPFVPLSDGFLLLRIGGELACAPVQKKKEKGKEKKNTSSTRTTTGDQPVKGGAFFCVRKWKSSAQQETAFLFVNKVGHIN